MLEIFIIIGLLLYIAFIHYQSGRQKKNVNPIGKTEDKNQIHYSQYDDVNSNYWSHNVNNKDSANPAGREDFFSEEALEFIFDRPNSKLFLHYTSEQSVANKILSEGFKFATSFYKTTEEVYYDLTDLIYKHNKMKAYGRFVIVICIDKTLYNNFLKEIQKFSSYEIFVEQILTETPSYLNEESDEIYQLHPKFIKGCIDYKSGKIIKNPDFAPSYDSMTFKENLKKFDV